MAYLGDILQPAFAVGPITLTSVDKSSPPATAEEYLQRVVLEAAECDDIMVAEIDGARFAGKQTPVFHSIPGCVQAPPHATPSIEWQQKQVANFSAVRRKLERWKTQSSPESPIHLPDLYDERSWLLFCFGDTLPVSHLRPKEDVTSSEGGTPPLVSVLLKMNQPVVEQVLEYHINWLHGRTNMTSHQGRWLYALMAALELPLTPDMCFLLRTLARECATLRCTLGEEEAQRETVTALNLIICIVALYFRQADLADS